MLQIMYLNLFFRHKTDFSLAFTVKASSEKFNGNLHFLTSPLRNYELFKLSQ